MKRTRKLLLMMVLILALTLGLTTVTGAITNGKPDGNNHPYVVMIVFYDSTNTPRWRCSGSLVSSKVVLTAGHCTTDDLGGSMPRAQVWVQPDMAGTGYPFKGGTWGVPHTNPNYNKNPYPAGNGLPAFSYRDVGVVVLDRPIKLSQYAQLPIAGLVDTLKNKTKVDFVGYGVQEQIHGGGMPEWDNMKVRMYAPGELVSGSFVHSDGYMRLSLNSGGDSGGTCFGDSGGPDLLGATRTVLAVNSYVTNSNCSGVGYSARVDIPEVLTWIRSYIK